MSLQNIILEHYSPRIQMSVGQITAVGAAIRSSAPGANVLIFGCGNDSILWHNINHDGHTLFLEDDPDWIEKVRKLNPSLVIEHVLYGDRTVENSLPIDEEELSQHPIPPAMLSREWDVVVIDAPRGHKPWLPGRSLPIYWSSLIARPETHVFIDDSSRRLEKAYSERFFRANRPWSTVISRVVQKGVPSTSSLLWVIGAGPAFQEEALAAQAAALQDAGSH